MMVNFRERGDLVILPIIEFSLHICNGYNYSARYLFTLRNRFIALSHTCKGLAKQMY